MHKYKVCVYAICKNEEKFLKKSKLFYTIISRRNRKIKYARKN